MPLIVQSRNPSPVVLDHSETPPQLELNLQQSPWTIHNNLHEPSERQGEPFEKHSNWTSPHRTGRHGWQASWELLCCTSSLLWIGVLLFRAAANLLLQWTRSPGQQKLFSSSLKTDQTKDRFGSNCTVTNVCIVFNQSFSLEKKKLCSDLYQSLRSWCHSQVRRTSHITNRGTDC